MLARYVELSQQNGSQNVDTIVTHGLAWQKLAWGYEGAVLFLAMFTGPCVCGYMIPVMDRVVHQYKIISIVHAGEGQAWLSWQKKCFLGACHCDAAQAIYSTDRRGTTPQFVCLNNQIHSLPKLPLKDHAH